MDLQTFISETIMQIYNGMHDASQKLGSKGVEINPQFMLVDKSYANQAFTFVDDGNHQVDKVYMIHFDVALTVEEGTQSTTGGGLRVYGIELGKKGQKEASSASQTRIQFTIPVKYPKSMNSE